MATIAPGTRMGPYKVVSFLAAGGMGEVYRGHDARLGRHVAIKILRAEAFSSEEAVRRFEREARAAAAVSHPNLVSIHDVGCERGVHYLVMDLLEGQNLRERLASGALAWPDALRLAIAIVEVEMTRAAQGDLTRILSAVFLLISMFFVYRSFYGMRIGTHTESEPATVAKAA